MRVQSIEHQPRDIALLRDLFVSRVMTLAHIAALHFDGRAEAAKKRVQKLKLAGFIGERPRKARDPGVLFLTQSGFELLTQSGELADLPKLSVQSFDRRANVSDLTLRHELAVMDVKAALQPAIAKVPRHVVAEFTTWPTLCEFEAEPRGYSRLAVKPDGRIRVRDTTGEEDDFEHTFFLEVDRGTETLDTLTKRCLAYRDHYTSGGFAVSCGARREEFADHPFRVLIVLPSDARRDNLADALFNLSPPIRTQVWLTIMHEITSDPLGSIWLRPADFRNESTRGERHTLFSE